MRATRVVIVQLTTHGLVRFHQTTTIPNHALATYLGIHNERGARDDQHTEYTNTHKGQRHKQWLVCATSAKGWHRHGSKNDGTRGSSPTERTGTAGAFS